MSSTFSAESAASPSDLNERECKPSHSVRSIHTARPSCGNIGRALRSSKTSGACTLQTPASDIEIPMTSTKATTSDLLTLFAAVSPVRMSPYQTSQETASMAPEAVSGSSTPELLASYDRASSSWRTSQSCLLEGWEEFSERWPISGMMLNGECFAASISDYPLSVSGSGLLPSPNARDGKDVSSTSVHLASRQRHQPSAATRLLERGISWKLISTAYELMMGFPSRWSAAVYTVAATRSSRKSRKSSAGQS